MDISPDKLKPLAWFAPLVAQFILGARFEYFAKSPFPRLRGRSTQPTPEWTALVMHVDSAKDAWPQLEQLAAPAPSSTLAQVVRSDSRPAKAAVARYLATVLVELRGKALDWANEPVAVHGEMLGDSSQKTVRAELLQVALEAREDTIAPWHRTVIAYSVRYLWPTARRLQALQEAQERAWRKTEDRGGFSLFDVPTPYDDFISGESVGKRLRHWRVYWRRTAERELDWAVPTPSRRLHSPPQDVPIAAVADPQVAFSWGAGPIDLATPYQLSDVEPWLVFAPRVASFLLASTPGMHYHPVGFPPPHHTRSPYFASYGQYPSQEWAALATETREMSLPECWEKIQDLRSSSIPRVGGLCDVLVSLREALETLAAEQASARTSYGHWLWWKEARQSREKLLMMASRALSAKAAPLDRACIAAALAFKWQHASELQHYWLAQHSAAGVARSSRVYDDYMSHHRPPLESSRYPALREWWESTAVPLLSGDSFNSGTVNHEHAPGEENLRACRWVAYERQG